MGASSGGRPGDETDGCMEDGCACRHRGAQLPRSLRNTTSSAVADVAKGTLTEPGDLEPRDKRSLLDQRRARDQWEPIMWHG